MPRIVSHFGQMYEIPTQLWSDPLISIQLPLRKLTEAPHFEHLLIINLRLGAAAARPLRFSSAQRMKPFLRRKEVGDSISFLAHETQLSGLCELI
jgi:hypothetical protein